MGKRLERDVEGRLIVLALSRKFEKSSLFKLRSFNGSKLGFFIGVHNYSTSLKEKAKKFTHKNQMK